MHDLSTLLTSRAAREELGNLLGAAAIAGLEIVCVFFGGLGYAETPQGASDVRPLTTEWYYTRIEPNLAAFSQAASIVELERALSRDQSGPDDERSTQYLLRIHELIGGDDFLRQSVWHAEQCNHLGCIVAFDFGKVVTNPMPELARRFVHRMPLNDPDVSWTGYQYPYGSRDEASEPAKRLFIVYYCYFRKSAAVDHDKQR